MPRLALKTPFRGGSVQDLAQEVLRISRGGLERRGREETKYLLQLEAIAGGWVGRWGVCVGDRGTEGCSADDVDVVGVGRCSTSGSWRPSQVGGRNGGGGGGVGWGVPSSTSSNIWRSERRRPIGGWVMVVFGMG